MPPEPFSQSTQELNQDLDKLRAQFRSGVRGHAKCLIIRAHKILPFKKGKTIRSANLGKTGICQIIYSEFQILS